MSSPRIRPAHALLVIGLLIAGSAWAVMRAGNVGLTQGPATCDGPKHTYSYMAVWRAGPGARFQVNSGNQCALGGTVCGVSTKGCSTSCAAKGVCTAKLNACVIGKGSPWVRVVSLDGSVYQQITAAPPGKCP